MTVTPRGVGVSVGGRGARISANTSGRATRTIGIPGTGISSVSTLTTVHSAPARTAAQTRAPIASAPSQPSKPGMLAARWEKDLYKALLASDFSGLEAIARSDARARSTCIFADAIMHSYAAGDVERARSLTELLWREGYDPSSDPFLRNYFPNAVMQLGIVDGITVALPCDKDMLGLALAELRQIRGDLAGAIEVVEQLTPSSLMAVSLAELHGAQGRWSDVIGLTDGVTNEDDFSTYLLIQRGVAFREQCYYDAAREAFKTAYAARSREVTLRRMALIERGQTYLAEGKKALARKDFEKVLAEDAHYPGLAEHLASLES